MKDTLKNLEAKEVQFSAELDAAQKEFASLQEQVADFDPIDLYNARQAIRPEMEQDAVHKLQERYTDEYSYTTMVDGRREVSLMLDEFFFLLVNSTLFTTSIYHHANFFLADLFVCFIRINAQKSQNSISRSR